MNDPNERRLDHMRGLLRTARARNERLLAEAVAAPARRGRKRKAVRAPAAKPFSTDEADAIMRQALMKAAAVEVRWKVMLREA